MDKRSPEDIRKSIKSLVEEAESVSIDNEENVEIEKKSESKLDNVSLDLENKYKKNLIKKKAPSEDNLDLDLKQSCKLELNMGELTEKTILDSSGNSNKGLLIGDYKIKKVRKGEPMRRDSFIKVATKINNRRGAL